MREILGPNTIPVYDAEWEMWELVPAPGPEEQTVLREALGTILAQASMEERAVCEAILTTVATQEVIAQQLGTTRKSVERRLNRVRRRAGVRMRGACELGSSTATSMVSGWAARRRV
ncbi:hypothetical protein [Streptomyces sp. OE57]|uniref:hypothetical protein n=1 Tax=Streptomyces lacaronensis TaxID=3379885 RepID=UPI0039B74434